MLPIPDSIPGGFPALAVELLVSLVFIGGAVELGILALLDLRSKRTPR